MVGTERPLSSLERLSVAAGSARGLAELHAQGIIHRDVKTTNILLDTSGAALVADMGLCRVLKPSHTHTRTRRMGTDGYIDPEYSETLELREQSDVYSFGVVLLELLTNQAAYTEGLTPPGLVGRFRAFLRAGRPIATFAAKDVRFPDWVASDLAGVAEGCLRLPGVRRPRMADVVRSLDKLSILARTVEAEAALSPSQQPSSPLHAKGAPPPAPPSPTPHPLSGVRPAWDAASKDVSALSGTIVADLETSLASLRRLSDWAGGASRSGPAAEQITQSGSPGSVSVTFSGGGSREGAAAAPPHSGGLLSESDALLAAIKASSASTLAVLNASLNTALDPPASAAATWATQSDTAAAAAAAAAAPPSNAFDIRGSCTGGFEQLMALVLSAGGPPSRAPAVITNPDNVTNPAAPRPSDLPGLEAVIEALKRTGGMGGGAAAALAGGAGAAAQGGVEAVISGLRLNANRPLVCGWSLWALVELCRQSGVARGKVVTLGGLDAAVQAMSSHPGAPGVQEQGCALLASVCGGEAECGAAAVRAGGVGAAVGALRGGVAARQVGVTASSLWALAQLCECGGGREAAGEAGAAGAVAEAEAAWAGHAGVTAHARLAREKLGGA